MNYVHEVQSYQLILFQEHKINLSIDFFSNCQHFISVFVTWFGCLSLVLVEFDLFAQGDEETELVAINPKPWRKSWGDTPLIPGERAICLQGKRLRKNRKKYSDDNNLTNKKEWKNLENIDKCRQYIWLFSCINVYKCFHV